MLVLILLFPTALLAAVLAWMSWRARHRRTALILAGISLLGAGLGTGIVLGGISLYEAVRHSLAG